MHELSECISVRRSVRQRQRLEGRTDQPGEQVLVFLFLFVFFARRTLSVNQAQRGIEGTSLAPRRARSSGVALARAAATCWARAHRSWSRRASEARSTWTCAFVSAFASAEANNTEGVRQGVRQGLRTSFRSHTPRVGRRVVFLFSFALLPTGSGEGNRRWARWQHGACSAGATSRLAAVPGIWPRPNAADALRHPWKLRHSLQWKLRHV